MSAAASGGSGEAAAFDNPFRMPSDEMVFLMRDEQRKSAAAERDHQKSLPVWKKTTNSQRQQRIRRVSDDDIIPGASAVRAKARGIRQRGHLGAATSAIKTERRREKENMTDFIMKKREMFLVQMSLDTKREEIRKLEEKAQMKEQALKKSELMLEEDAIRFDTFLKENDQKAHEAIKKAERETRLKQEKMQEIKKLHQEIQAIQSEMSKLREHLDDCERYKTFLDSLTPEEWFEEQRQGKLSRARERMQEARGIVRGKWEEECRVLREQYEAQVKADEAANKRKKKKRRGKKAAESPRPVLSLPPEPVFQDSETDYLSDTESPMYFQDPAQLLNIFTALEEQNLFLIQNSQETEQALEELKQTFRSTKASMEQKTSALESNIMSLEQQIEAEQEKTTLLHRRAKANNGEDAQAELLSNLKNKVREVYESCGFDAESNPSTLTMLTDLEARLEDLLTQIEQMPEDYVKQAETAKDKERRERDRAARLAAQQEAYQKKLEISMRRSMQAPKRRTGKPVMMRSAPLFRRKKVEKEEVQDEHAADQQYFM